LADKDFRVKNKLHVNGLSQNSGVILATNNALDAHTNVPTQYGGTGTTTSPNAGQILYSASGSTYAPSNTSVVYPSQQGNAGKILTTDGSSVSWTTFTSYDGGVASTVYSGGINGGGAS
jgi:hypothetical protein